MISVNLYQPKVIDETIEFPSCWNDLQPGEIQFIARTLLAEKQASTSKALIFKYIVETRAKKLDTTWFFRLDPETTSLLLFPLLDFIFKENNLTNTPAVVNLKKTAYHPQKFENITCGEFEDAEVCANLFTEDPSPDHLVKLAAILFRPFTGKEIEPYMVFHPETQSFKTYDAEEKIPLFKKLKPEALYSIFIWYSGNRNQLPLNFPTVYEGGNESGKQKPDLLAFTKCIHMGAGPKNGTRQQIRMMKLFEFMFDMEQEAIRAKELERQYEEMSNQTKSTW